MTEQIKTLEEVAMESTCLKRTTICEIQDKDGIILSRESNRCSPRNGRCARLSTVQDKENYDRVSDCNWVHAEMMAIANLPDGSKPYRALLYGHSFFCKACEDALTERGVMV